MPTKKRPHFPKGRSLEKVLKLKPGSGARSELRKLNLRIDLKSGRLVSVFGSSCFAFTSSECTFNKNYDSD